MRAPKPSSEGLAHLAPLMRATAACWVGTVLMVGASFTSCGLLLLKAKHH